MPRPVSETAARALIDAPGETGGPAWIAARDTAILSLLYGCGLRISEALALTGADHPLPQTLRVTGKGGRTRIVPVLPQVREAVTAYMALCPHPVGRKDALFRAVRGACWARARCRRRWRCCARVSACRPVPRPTPCATRLRPICWPMAAI